MKLHHIGTSSDQGYHIGPDARNCVIRPLTPEFPDLVSTPHVSGRTRGGHQRRRGVSLITLQSAKKVTMEKLPNSMGSLALSAAGMAGSVQARSMR